jgi:hypothetical protein
LQNARLMIDGSLQIHQSGIFALRFALLRLNSLREIVKFPELEPLGTLYSYLGSLAERFKDFRTATILYKKALAVDTAINKPQSAVQHCACLVRLFQLLEDAESVSFYKQQQEVYLWKSQLRTIREPVKDLKTTPQES